MTASLQFIAIPERRLIAPSGSFRHVHFHIEVAAQPVAPTSTRPPLTIGLVLDRSGSMHGQKIATARTAAVSVLDRLREQDRVAAVIFDHQIDVLQEAAPATAEVKARLRAELSSVQARGNTALHEGWLTGCRVIAPEAMTDDRLSRCFLLTDGLANVGVTDAEQIAAQAADVRANAGIGTSTFGIGLDYDEGLLGPMAVAGGGQFHHLRDASEIASTFLGELGELLAVAARNVCLELQGGSGMTAELVSAYWLSSQLSAETRWVISLGDLLAGETRDVVVRIGFLGAAQPAHQVLRARLRWTDASGEHTTQWTAVVFETANDAMRHTERADPNVLRVVGVHHAERAQRRAIELSRGGDVDGARKLLQAVAGRIAEYAGSDAQLQGALSALRAAEQDLQAQGYAPMAAKEAYYGSQLRTRSQRDLRSL
jgi:Ca-activated chloride channel family protein